MLWMKFSFIEVGFTAPELLVKHSPEGRNSSMTEGYLNLGLILGLRPANGRPRYFEIRVNTMDADALAPWVTRS